MTHFQDGHPLSIFQYFFHFFRGFEAMLMVTQIYLNPQPSSGSSVKEQWKLEIWEQSEEVFANPAAEAMDVHVQAVDLDGHCVSYLDSRADSFLDYE
jgi:hypothetical protein